MCHTHYERWRRSSPEQKAKRSAQRKALYASNAADVLRRRREAYAENPQPSRDRKNAWYADNADLARAKARDATKARGSDRRLSDAKGKLDWKYRKVHGLSLERVERMHAEQSGLCAICRKRMNPVVASRTQKTACTAPVLDHCHSTGVIRGLLCNHCNRGLGLFLDDPIALRAAADYVEKRDETMPVSKVFARSRKS